MEKEIVALLLDIKKELQEIKEILKPSEFVPEDSSGIKYSHESSSTRPDSTSRLPDQKFRR